MRQRGRGRGISRESEGEGEHEAERILAVQVEAVESFLRDEAEGGVQRERGRVVEFGLECDLCDGRRIVSVFPIEREGREEWMGRKERGWGREC